MATRVVGEGWVENVGGFGYTDFSMDAATASDGEIGLRLSVSDMEDATSYLLIFQRNAEGEVTGQVEVSNLTTAQVAQLLRGLTR